MSAAGAACALLVLCFASPVAGAEAGLAVDALGGVRQFNFEEYDGRERINRERGYLPALELGLKWTAPRYRVALDAGIAGDTVDHDGETQSGRPFSSRTDTELTDVAVTLRTQLLRLRRVELAVLTGAGQRDWRRDILSAASVEGIGERYRMRYWRAGLALVHRTRQRDYALELSRLFGLQVRETVHFLSRFDSVRLSPRARNSWRASLSTTRLLGERWALVAGFSYVEMAFGDSPARPLSANGAVVGEIFQPGGEMQTLSATIGLRYRH